MNPDVCKLFKLSFIVRTLPNTSECHTYKISPTNEKSVPSSEMIRIISYVDNIF